MRALRTVAAPLALAVAVLALSGCPPRQAEQAPPPQLPSGPAPVVDVPDEPADDSEPTVAEAGALTKEAVASVMESMNDSAVMGKLESIGEDLGLEDAESVESVKAIMEAAADSDEVAEAVRPHGFDSAAAWVDAFTRVLPGLGPASARAFGLDEPAEPSADDEYAIFVEAYGKPTDEDIDVIAEVIKDQVEAEEPKTAE